LGKVVDLAELVEDDEPGSGPDERLGDPRMDFKVFTPAGIYSYQDGASYALNSEGPGTLHVRTAEGSVISYGPTGWRWLQEMPPPPPSPPPAPMDPSKRRSRDPVAG
jgi:hypothetical protein